MKTLAILAVAIGLGALLHAQDEGKKKVEQPLKKAVVSSTADSTKTLYVERPLLEAAKSLPAEKFDLSKTGIEWHKGIVSVLNKGKPILLLQILGNYDDVYC